MAYQRGSLKKVRRKEGEIWVLRYRVTNPDGKRVEHVTPIGLVREFPKDKDAWREADRLALPVRINDNPLPGRIRFDFLAEHYLKADFGADSVRPKSVNTISHVEHIVRAYLVPRFGNEVAEDIRPLVVQRWLKSLHEPGGLAWTTISKMRGVMHRIYKVGILHGHVAKNPVQHVETRSKTDYKAIVITPSQTLAILKALPSPLHFTLVLTCAATALRASEMLALRWSDLLWNEGRIRISKRWAKGKDGDTKTEASDGYVPLHPVLAAHLRSWRAKRLPEWWRLRVSLHESPRPCSPHRLYVRRQSSAACSKEGRSTHRRRPEVRTSQPASQLKQLAGEQGESRTEDRAGYPASREDSDDARSVHAGRW
jgi:integrase